MKKVFRKTSLGRFRVDAIPRRLNFFRTCLLLDVNLLVFQPEFAGDTGEDFPFLIPGSVLKHIFGVAPQVNRATVGSFAFEG